MQRWFKRGPEAPANDDSSSRSASTTASSRKIFPSGIKLLYTAENSVVDIIFVHGLTGDREKTWKAKNNAAPWPQTLLPSKVPNARILTFGYDAYVTDLRGLVSKNRIGNHSMNLLTTIATFREYDDTNNRPIVFVCHSLGGLVCEDALVAARQRPERYAQNVFRSTRGIIFLATPHHGAGLATWAGALARSIGLLRQTNSRILRVLEKDSEVLARIQDSFHTMIRSRNIDGLQPIEITCFYEELPLPGVGDVVPRESAILSGYISRGIRKNHMDMTKFENGDDPGFIAIAGELRRWVKESIAISSAGATSNITEAVKIVFVPYTRNPGFVGRSDILEKVKERLAPSLQPNQTNFHARAALFGLGGIGKTQIALDYAYRIRREFPAVSVFWVHASSVERFQQAYSQIAQSCQIPGYSNPKINILELVKGWLEGKDQRPWLMIIDNADDTDMFFSSGEAATQEPEDPNRLPFGGALGRYTPECSHGAILVTTRNKQTGNKLTKGRGMIEVRKMDQAESSQLIHERLENDNLDPKQISFLTDRLENLPLAIVQATAFIQENSLTVARYLELLDQGDNVLVELLSQPFEAEGRDSSIPNAVTATWIISFKKIREQCPDASDLLSLLSFFDRQGIPKVFLSHYIKKNFEKKKRQQKLEDEANNTIELEKTLGILKAYQFVWEGKSDGNLNMHRLIPLVMRNWLRNESKFGEWAGKALLIVSKIYPRGRHENRKICGEYLPHANAVLSYEGSSSTTEAVAKAKLLHNSGYFLYTQGQWNKAEELLLKAVETRKRVFGSEGVDTLSSISALAMAYWRQRRWNEAEELEIQVTEAKKRVLGDEHSATLTSLHNLTWTYLDQGRLKEAEELGIPTMETTKRVFGDEHPDTLDSMNLLAEVYSDQGRLEEAEELRVQVMETTKRVFGDEHPDTLQNMNFLARLYSDQGRLKEAEKLGAQATETRKRVLGDEYPDTLQSMNFLARLYSDQGRLKEPEKLGAQATETRKRVLGDEHPDTLNSMGSLALIYQNQGRLKDAEELEIQLLTKRQKILGKVHPDTLIAMNNLALTWRHQNRNDEAIKLMAECVQLRKKILGENHPYTKTSIESLDEWEKEKGSEALSEEALSNSRGIGKASA